jgi:hypothetical protein
LSPPVVRLSAAKRRLAITTVYLRVTLVVKGIAGCR